MAKFTVALIELFYGTAFSLCSLVTVRSLFYRNIKKKLLFPFLAGAVFGLAAFLMNLYFGLIDRSALYLVHTVLIFLMLTEKNADALLSLILAQLFSGSLINSVQTAVFSVARGAERSFLAVTLLYLVGSMLAVAFVLLLQRLVRSDDREPLGIIPMILLTGIFLFVTTLINRSFTMSNYVPDVSPAAAIPSVLMLMSGAVLLLLSVKQQQAKRFSELHLLDEKYMTSQARHFEQAREADTEMCMLRHDMKNHIVVMNGLLASGKTEELRAYLKTLDSSLAELQAVNSTGNEIADAILAEKRMLAEKENVKLVIDGSLNGLQINAVTLCTVLSNLLDNALEATALTDSERIISVSAKRTGSFFYLCISNPCASAVEIAGEIPTSKSNTMHHGIGLKSVRNALEKCGGTLELSCKEQGSGFLFQAEVILPAES